MFGGTFGAGVEVDFFSGQPWVSGGFGSQAQRAVLGMCEEGHWVWACRFLPVPGWGCYPFGVGITSFAGSLILRQAHVDFWSEWNRHDILLSGV